MTWELKLIIAMVVLCIIQTWIGKPKSPVKLRGPRLTPARMFWILFFFWRRR